MKSDLSVGKEPEAPVIIEAETVRKSQASHCKNSIPISKCCNEALGHGRLVLSRWDAFLRHLNDSCGGITVTIDGVSLDIASVEAAARQVL